MLALVAVIFAAVVAAQAPPNAPCTAASVDCCSTTLQSVVISGVTYVHQVCAERSTNMCSKGCDCIGLCEDNTARCSCVTQTTTPAAGTSRSPTAIPVSMSRGLSSTSSPSPSATASSSESATVSTSFTASASPTPSLAAKLHTPGTSSTPFPTIVPVEFSMQGTQTPAPSSPVSVQLKKQSSSYVIVLSVLIVVAITCGAAIGLVQIGLRRALRAPPTYASAEMMEKDE